MFVTTIVDAIQSGSVFTPRALSDKGFAQRAVAIHLEEMKARCIKTAIFFLCGNIASWAYSASSFSKLGAYMLLDFDPPVHFEASR